LVYRKCGGKFITKLRNLKFSYTIRNPLYKPRDPLVLAWCLLYKSAKTMGVVGWGSGSKCVVSGGELRAADSTMQQTEYLQ
jgi:hypothetical protein